MTRSPSCAPAPSAAGASRWCAARASTASASALTAATCASLPSARSAATGAAATTSASPPCPRPSAARTVAARARRSSARCRSISALPRPASSSRRSTWAASRSGGSWSCRRWCSMPPRPTRSPPRSSTGSPPRCWRSCTPRSSGSSSAAPRSRCCSAAGCSGPATGACSARSRPASGRRWSCAWRPRSRSWARRCSGSTSSAPGRRRSRGRGVNSGRWRYMAEVRYVQATRTYPGNDEPAVDALDLEIADGELMVLVGPSGSGKTTALRMLAGLEEVDAGAGMIRGRGGRADPPQRRAGAVMIGGRDVSDDPPKRRDVAMVFQNYALYPYLTVGDNIGFPLRMARVPKGQREARVREVADLLELTPFLERKPGQLSGGQRQRVAMGRAIVREPQVFLLDEPLSNLDAKLRVQMRADIAELQARLAVTTVYVTHDQAEAMTLGHRVAVLRDARLQQCDTPRVLFDRPVNIFVAGFVGSPSMNLCRVPLRDDGAAAFGALGLELPGLRASGRREAIVGVRPEAMELAGDGLDAGVELVEELGSDAFVYCSAELAGMPARLVARVPARHAPGRGERVRLRPSPEYAPHVFDAETGERIG